MFNINSSSVVFIFLNPSLILRSLRWDFRFETFSQQYVLTDKHLRRDGACALTITPDRQLNKPHSCSYKPPPPKNPIWTSGVWKITHARIGNRAGENFSGLNTANDLLVLWHLHQRGQKQAWYFDCQLEFGQRLMEIFRDCYILIISLMTVINDIVLIWLFI